MLFFGSLLNFGINNDRVVQINAFGELSGVIDDPYLRKTQTLNFLKWTHIVPLAEVKETEI